MIELLHAATGGGISSEAWAALVEDDRLLGFSQDAPGALAQAGDIHIGVLRSIDRSRGVASVLLVGGQETLLDLPRSGPKLVEGSRLLIQVQRPAQGSKRTKVSTRIVLDGRVSSVVLTGSPEQLHTEAQAAATKDAAAKREASQLLAIAETVKSAAGRATGPVRIRSGRGCVADLLFRFPDALPTNVQCDSRNAADALQRSLSDDPVGSGISVAYAPLREWRVSTGDLQSMIEDMFEPRYSLPSGGWILIEQGETLTAIDVNTGSAGSNSGAERLAIETNRDAAIEIARQVRFLNLAGNVVIDFVGTRAKGEQRDLVDRLRAAFGPDPAQPWIGPMSPIGLVEMSRRRLGRGPVRRLTEPHS
jgi:Ribonuclease G/E